MMMGRWIRLCKSMSDNIGILKVMLLLDAYVGEVQSDTFQRENDLEFRLRLAVPRFRRSCIVPARQYSENYSHRRHGVILKK